MPNVSFLFQTLGGVVESSTSCEYGHAEIKTESSSELYNDEPSNTQSVWMSHGDHAEKLPQGFSVAALSETVGHHCLPEIDMKTR